MNDINERLFTEIQKRIEKDTGKTLWGQSHPVNILMNLQDDIIEGYALIQKLKSERTKAENNIKRINAILGDKC